MSPLEGGLCLVQRQLTLLLTLNFLLMSYISAYDFFVNTHSIYEIPSLPKVVAPKLVLPQVRKLVE